MRDYQVTVPPVGSPVTLEEAKNFLRVSSDYEDVLIESLIASATSTLEAYTRRDFVERTYAGFYDSVLCSCSEVYPFVKIYRSPLQSIVSVQTIQDGAVYADESYQIKKQPTFSRVLFDQYINGQDVPFPLRVEFIAGYGEASDVPADIKLAIMQYVNFLYSNRGDCEPECGMGMPVTIKNLLAPYRIIDTFGV